MGTWQEGLGSSVNSEQEIVSSLSKSWKVFYINHFQKPHLTESDNIGVEDDEAEAEDDSDAEVEPNRRIQLAAEISVKPTRSFFLQKMSESRWEVRFLLC